MKEILDFISTNSAALTVIFTAVVTISTVIYALLTRSLVYETKLMREVQTEPKIHITTESYDFAVHIIRLNIKNIGLGPANNLVFETSVISGGKSAEILLGEFTGSNFFKTGIRHFGPGQNIYSTYTQTNEDCEGKLMSVLSFKLSYQSAAGKKYNEEIILDMSELKGTYQLGKPNLYSIASSLEKIQEDIRKIANGKNRIKVDSYSNEDRNNEIEERKRHYEEYKNRKSDS